MSHSAQPAPARARATPQQQVDATPDYVKVAQQNEAAVLDKIEKNPIYKFIIDGDAPKEQRVAQVVTYLTAGLQDGAAKVEELDKRREALAEFNAFIQVLRKQLGAEQAKEITSKAYADFQRIVTSTTEDVHRFEQELAPLGQLAELFTKYGADGNIIEKINLAKDQKRVRERNLTLWQKEHDSRLAAALLVATNLKTTIADDKDSLAEKWFGRARIEARIANSEMALTDAEAAVIAVRAEQPVDSVPQNEIEQVDEGILELQNIGGEAFRKAVEQLHQHTEEALAKIAANFDEAVRGLTNTRSSFIAMDRNCSDASFALSILENAVQTAEAQSRTMAEGIIKTDESTATGGMAELERMERERRSATLLSYTGSLTTFLKDVGVAVASLRSGQAVIQNILRMNQLALESANTHKITGIANTADAVTIIIGSIIEVCNRAASRALADGLIKIRTMAEEGNTRLAGGTYESLQMQNTMLGSFVDSVRNLREMTAGITANSVELLKDQFSLVGQMRDESTQLADATTDAQRTSFAARAGVLDQTRPDDPPRQARRGFGLRIPD